MQGRRVAAMTLAGGQTGATATGAPGSGLPTSGSETSHPPVPWIERIDPLPPGLWRHVIPDGREGEDLFAVDHHPAGDAERPVDREDLARGPGNDLSLEPAVLRALARVKLPNQICGDPAKIPYTYVAQLAVADGTAHRRARVQTIARRYRSESGLHRASFLGGRHSTAAEWAGIAG